MRIIVHLDLVFEDGTVKARPISWTPAGPAGEKIKPETIYELVLKSFESDAMEASMDTDRSAATRGSRLTEQPVVSSQDSGLVCQTVSTEFGITEMQAANMLKLVGRSRFVECMNWVRQKVKSGECRSASGLFISLINKSPIDAFK